MVNWMSLDLEGENKSFQSVTFDLFFTISLQSTKNKVFM